MRKNYFLSLFFCLSASINVWAQLTAPSNLQGTAVGGSSDEIGLTWTDNDLTETGYQVAYSSTTPTYLTTEFLSSGPSVGSLTSLNPNTTYTIWIRAYKSSGTSTPTCTPGGTPFPTNGLPAGATQSSCWVGPITVTTNASTTIPLSPSNAYIRNDEITPKPSITVRWTDNSTNEESFKIERSVDNGVNWTVLTTSFAPHTGTGEVSYEDNVIENNRRYKYRITAVNSVGSSLTSAESNETKSAPSTPKEFALDSFGSNTTLKGDGRGLYSVDLRWYMSNRTDVAKYEISYSTVDRVINMTQTFGIKGATYEAATLTKLSEGTTYLLKVRAINGDGTPSYWSSELVVTTLKRTAPRAPYNVVALTASANTNDLKWSVGGLQDGITNNRVRIHIYRTSSGEDAGDYKQIADLGPDAESYSDNQAASNTKYWYKVVAVNYQGLSPVSSIVNAGSPFSPSQLATAMATDALGNPVIQATWKDNSNDEDSFTLERAIDADFTKEVVKAFLTKNTTSAVSLPLEEGLTYYFRVKSSNVNGHLAYSDVTKVSTEITAAPNAPYALKASASSGAVALTWGDDSNKEEGFEIERSSDGTTFAKIASTGRNENSYTDKTASKTAYYRVRAINSKGNSAYSNVAQVTVAGSSARISNETSEVFQVFPNPTANLVRVNISEEINNGEITVTDRMNRIVSKIVINPSQSEYNVDLSNFGEGAYLISVRTATQQISKRVLKF